MATDRTGRGLESARCIRRYMQIRALKAPYIFRDATRVAKMRGLAMAVPKSKKSAPDTLLAEFVYWGMHQDDPARAKRFLQLVWRRYFGEGQGIAWLDDLVRAAAEIGLSGQDMEIAAACAYARA